MNGEIESIRDEVKEFEFLEVLMIADNSGM
jgi:hypothetical protein